MLRERMIRTMPVVMIATAADWTDRFHRFRGVRKRPPDSMLKASHRMTRAATSPSRRLSTSRPANMDRAVRFGGVVATVGCSIAWASVMTTPHRRQMVWERPASRETASAGRVTWISDGLRATGDGTRRDVLAELCLGQPLRVEDDLEVVLVGRQDLLHLGLRVLRLPAVGVDLGAGRDLDRTRGDERGDDLFHALAKEERVGLAELTLDDRVVAGRLGRRDCAGDHPSDFDVVVC